LCGGSDKEGQYGAHGERKSFRKRIMGVWDVLRRMPKKKIKYGVLSMAAGTYRKEKVHRGQSQKPLTGGDGRSILGPKIKRRVFPPTIFHMPMVCRWAW